MARAYDVVARPRPLHVATPRILILTILDIPSGKFLQVSFQSGCLTVFVSLKHGSNTRY
ncbi:hypothetical protein M404DRAFT_999951 [Pisolithus tinctorius Marx 270]|uniref:Uncharacterized protein n=1 Tax=Pisolithus tinctorius Marx 270 TaxID=870435 RepID=A0A0C3NWW5_PISTI|nr:hypothetical protein M404DRAFT_999951 [Pisolithus tinctorius Marx 270]